jgi:hypothetical protein
VIFQRFDSKIHSSKNDECIVCKDGWHLIFSLHHWSTLNTCKDFVNNIQLNYGKTQIDILAHQNMIWFINCWSVHINKEFRVWMKNNHPIIDLFFIPANCTFVFHPTNVI